MSCKVYCNQDECRYYPVDCDNCENSYSYDNYLTEEEVEEKEKELQAH